MLQISISTIFMTVVTTNLFLTVLALSFCHTDFMVRVGYRQLALFVIFALVRLLFPVELPFTITVFFPLSVSKIIAFVHQGLFTIGGQPISLWQLFKWIWAIGCLAALAYNIDLYRRTRSHIVLCAKKVDHKEPYASMLQRVCAERGKPNRFTILMVPGLSMPAICGFFSPRILLPENLPLTEKELYFILMHETSHYFRHDLWNKQFVKMISILYWWNPFCHLLNSQADVILEMRIDHDVSRSCAYQITEYTNCLLNLSERSLALSKSQSQSSSFDTFSLPLLRPKNSDLYKRTNILLKKPEKSGRTLNIALTAATCAVYLFSYLFIWEASCSPEIPIPLCPAEYNLISPTSEESYFIDNEDGTYDLYYGDLFFETVDSLKYYSKKIPVYTKDSLPLPQ